MNKRNFLILLIVMLCVIPAGCTGQKDEDTQQEAALLSKDMASVSYTDALSRTIEFSEQEIEALRAGEYKVAVLSGSFAEIWSIAGGTLSAVTEDAYDEDREILIGEDTVNAGSLKSPSLEILIGSEIDLAILSADTSEHVALMEQFENVGIKTVYFSVETFDDYLEVMKFCTRLTGRDDLYDKYGEGIRGQIDEQIARQDGSNPTVLFIRAYSTGAKAKGSDNMTGIMLKELGCVNIADSENQLLDDLSMEVILERNPDYIFVTTMGSDDEAALNSVKTLLSDNPAWNSLNAVINDHYYVLPKNMFHNKPNQRWGESYKMLADILYPEK